MDRRTFKGDALVFGAVVTWALAFPIAKDALDRTTGWGDYVCSFNTLRFSLVFAILFPAALWGYGQRLKKAHRRAFQNSAPAAALWGYGRLKKYIWPSICVGGSLVVAYLFQSFAYLYTSSGTVAFITAMSVVLVPIWDRYCGKPIAKGTVVGITLATVGLGFMSLTSDFTLNFGVLLAFVGAVGYAADIILVEKFRQQTKDPKRPFLSAVTFVAMQSFVIALMMSPLALSFEVPARLPTMTANVVKALMYLAIVATALGFTLQVIGQRYTTAVRMALISTLEAVIAATAGYFMLGERFSVPMCIGVALILLGTGLSEVSKAISESAESDSSGEFPGGGETPALS